MNKNALQQKTTPGLFIIGIILLVLGIDGFWFVSSEIHDHCIFNLTVGHNVYADSYKPCEIASLVITGSGILFISGLSVLIFGAIKKLKK